jgi:histone H3/H4
MLKNKELSDDNILKLCKKAGIKSISNDSYDKIREIIDFKLDNILSISIMLKNNDNTPRETFMVKDLKKSLNHLDYNITE